MIGSSNGNTYESEFDHALGRSMENSETGKDMPNIPDPEEVSPISKPDGLGGPTDNTIKDEFTPSNRQIAGDVRILRIPANDNKNLDLGLGGMSEKEFEANWKALAKKLNSQPPVLTIIPGDKK